MKKKYHSREEIIAKIDSVKEEFKRDSERAEDYGREADEIYALSAKETDLGKIGRLIKEAGVARHNEQKLLKKLKNVPKRLEGLKHTLAAFDTIPMPFVDSSVMAQT
jgi:hypothetical protein